MMYQHRIFRGDYDPASVVPRGPVAPATLYRFAILHDGARVVLMLKLCHVRCAPLWLVERQQYPLK